MVQFIGVITLFIANFQTIKILGACKCRWGDPLSLKNCQDVHPQNSTPGLPTQSRTEKKWSQDEESAKWGAFHAITKKAAVLFFLESLPGWEKVSEKPAKNNALSRPACNWSTLKTPCNGSFCSKKSMEKTVASVKSATFQQRKLHRCRQPCQKLAKTISCWSLPSPILFLPWETFVLPHLHIPQLLHMSKAPSTTAMPAKIHVT